nr:DUF5713 family protein [Lysinibacillus sphaericus]
MLGGDNYPLKTVEELWRYGVPKYESLDSKGGNIVKKLDSKFNYLEDMYEDSFFPSFLVDKIKLHIVHLVHFIEENTYTVEEIQGKLDEMTIAINELQNEFYENDSEIETFARDSIGLTVERILQYFEIDIDIEEALRERDW